MSVENNISLIHYRSVHENNFDAKTGKFKSIGFKAEGDDENRGISIYISTYISPGCAAAARLRTGKDLSKIHVAELCINGLGNWFPEDRDPAPTLSIKDLPDEPTVYCADPYHQAIVTRGFDKVVEGHLRNALKVNANSRMKYLCPATKGENDCGHDCSAERWRKAT